MMRYFFSIFVLSFQVLLAMEKQESGKNISFDFYSMNDESYKHFKVIRTIQELVRNYIKNSRRPEEEEYSYLVVPEVVSIPRNTCTQQGLLFKVLDGRLDGMYGPWGPAGLVKLYYNNRVEGLSTTVLEGINILIGPKIINEPDKSELWPILQFEDITLPQPIQNINQYKNNGDKYDLDVQIKIFKILSQMAQRYIKESEVFKGEK